MKTLSFEQTVVAGLGDESASAAALGDLLAALESAIPEAERIAAAAYQDFLDPIKTPNANDARGAVERTQFAADRLKTLLPRLQDRYREVQAREAVTAWRQRFDALEIERDALAVELKRVYPPGITAITAVLDRVADLDRRLSELHESRPEGAKGVLKSAELIARDLSEFSRDEPPIGRDLKLPDWSQSCKLLWPRPQPSRGFELSAPLPHDPRRSADWHEALAEDTRRRKAEEQRKLEQEKAAEAESRDNYQRRAIR